MQSPTTDIDWDTYPTVLPTDAVAQLMGLTVGGVRARYRTGMIPAHHIAGRWIVFRDQFRPWMQAQHGNPVTPLPHPVDEYDAVLEYRDLMRLFGITKQTIYVWLNTGALPAQRTGDAWIVYKWALREFLPPLTAAMPRHTEQGSGDTGEV